MFCTPRLSLILTISICVLSGCYSSSAPPSGNTSAEKPSATANEAQPQTETTGKSTDATESATATATPAGAGEYPDVPQIAIMTEVDGVPIPRLTQEAEDLQLEGKLPVDVGNPRAKQPSETARGDAVIVRMAGEPKSLNPITENSAVKSYILEYVNEGLARQDPETFEYLPHMAERWVAEDSVKLAPDYPGRERRLKMGDGEPQLTTEIDYTAPEKGGSEEPAVIELVTTDKDGSPLPNVWVGVYPKEKILGAPTTGYHAWSDAKGLAKLGGYPTGKYVVKVGAEVYGKTAKEPDGSLVVTPATAENPLHEELKSTPNSTLTLKPGEWIDRHEQTYYTYYLRPDVTWSDGEPFTTQDLEFAYAALNNPTVDGDHIRVYYQDLVECKALSPLAVRMRYRQQYFKAFEFTAGMSAYTPPWHLYVQKFKDQGKELTLERLTPEEEAAQKKVSAHGQEFGQYFNQDRAYNLAPLGTGPYQVAKWENNDRVELTRNHNYWNPERAGYLDKLIFKFIIDDNAVLPALQTGLIDFAFSLTPEQYFETLDGPPDWLAKDFVKADWYTPAFSYIGWNELKPLFQDRRVRIALGMLFDKQRFLETKMHNAGMIVSGSAYYFGPGYDHGVKPLAYDPETARDLLTEAGWLDSDNDGVLDKDGKKFSFEALIPNGRKIAEDRMALLQNELKSVGIEMNIRKFEWASFIEKIQQREFDVVTLSWAMPIESDPYQIWHGSGAGKNNRGSNHISFDNPTANELIEMLRITLDDKKRSYIAKAFHRLLDAEQPYQFLYCPKDLGAYHQRLRGVKWYRIRPGYDLLEWYVPKDEQLRN